MGRKTKLWLIIATSFVILGSIILTAVMAAYNWDFTKLSTVNYETSNYEITENYSNISIAIDTADVAFIPSDDAKTLVVCYEQENVKHSVAVKDGTLVIEAVDTRQWYEHIGIFFSSPKITVHLPQCKYGALTIKSSTGDVDIPKGFQFSSMDIAESTGAVTNRASVAETISIRTTTGDIHIEGISADALALSVSTGKVTVTDVTCKRDVKISVSTGRSNITNVQCQNLISDGDTGSISLKDVIAVERMSVERDTGDVRFDGSDAAEIFVKTDTGDVTGSLLTDKVFIAQTDTGRIDVPRTTTGGKCEVTTDTGDIKISILHS